jgi:hypothetical protein
MRWVKHVAHIGKTGNAYKDLVVKPEGKDHKEELDIDRRIK